MNIGFKISRLVAQKQGKVTVFFEDASKGNPRITGSCGMIYSYDGFGKDKFSWGLGHYTNNQAILGLLKGCQIAQEHRKKALQVFNDS